MLVQVHVVRRYVGSHVHLQLGQRAVTGHAPASNTQADSGPILPAPRLPDNGTWELVAPSCSERRSVALDDCCLVGADQADLDGACYAEGPHYSGQVNSCPLLPSCCTWSPVALQGLARQHGVVAIRVDLQAGQRGHLLLQATHLGT